MMFTSLLFKQDNQMNKQIYLSIKETNEKKTTQKMKIIRHGIEATAGVDFLIGLDCNDQ